MADIAVVKTAREQNSANEEFVKNSFSLFLGREPEEKALREYAEQLNSCQLTRQQFIILLVESEEYKAKTRNIRRVK